MSSMAEVFRDAFYETAQRMWPGLTAQQFGDAARAWLSRQHRPLSLSDVAVGIEDELTALYGPAGEAAYYSETLGRRVATPGGRQP
jgi:hypothetical protein